MRKIQIYEGRRGLLRRKQWYARLVSITPFDTYSLFRSTEGYNNRDELEDLCRDVFPGLDIEWMDPTSAVKS